MLSVPEVLPKMAENQVMRVVAWSNSAALNQRTLFTVTQPAIKKNKKLLLITHTDNFHIHRKNVEKRIAIILNELNK